MKKRSIIISGVMCLAVMMFAMNGCETDSKYGEKLDKSGVFTNLSSDALPQTVLFETVNAHFSRTTRTKKKALVLIAKGMRADALTALEDATSNILAIAKNGGAYLTYSGGAKGEIRTDGGPSLMSMLTGEWSNTFDPPVNKNTDAKGVEPLCFPTSLALKGYKTAVVSSWDNLLSVQMSAEIAWAEVNAKNAAYIKADSDALMQDKIKECIESNSLIVGIYSQPDTAGHSDKFSVNNEKYTAAVNGIDVMVGELTRVISQREQEDWLIIVTSDHGGSGKRHTQRHIEDTMTFLASNKPLTL